MDLADRQINLGKYAVLYECYKLIDFDDDLFDDDLLVESLAESRSYTHHKVSTCFSDLETAQAWAAALLRFFGESDCFHTLTCMYIARVEEVLYDARRMVDGNTEVVNEDILELP